MTQPIPPTGGTTISRLLSATVQEAWPTEAQHFTPWLLENSEHLSEVLGLQIQLERREHKVGKFSLDLIGKVSGSDEQVVIVENQFGDTDHGHLGQILTYAGGTEPAVIVWVAENFREEHRAALDWLNHNTTPDIKFFGVQLGAVRMKGASPTLLAPRLELVCKPNDWEKLAKLEASAAAVGAGTGLTATNALYKQFWEQFAVEAKKRGWTNATPPAQNWWSLPTGTATVTWGVSYAMFGARSELYFGSPDASVNLERLAKLEAHREAIQAEYGEDEILFDDLPGKVATRLEVRLQDKKIADEESWPEVVAWMVDTQARMRAAVDAVGGIPTATGSAVSGADDD